MSPFFTRRSPAGGATTSSTPAVVTTGRVGSSCESYAPGHQMHYIHQGQALRSPSVPVRNVIVDGTRVVVLLDDGTQHDHAFHDPARLESILALFPAARTLYPAFHALRVGPYWFNLGDDIAEPCPSGTP
ncbi:MAG: hypothetical protein ACLGH4_08630 [Actinomycetes bacterium]